jgi:hypothetical protein
MRLLDLLRHGAPLRGGAVLLQRDHGAAMAEENDR